MEYTPENHEKVSVDLHVDCEIYDTISVLDWVERTSGLSNGSEKKMMAWNELLMVRQKGIQWRKLLLTLS